MVTTNLEMGLVSGRPRISDGNHDLELIATDLRQLYEQ
jgi:hypothetical protein